ncbi:MAG: hypothetical protein QOE75_2023 [Solirubrobacterales bacterium]|jgi:hypothetical protein|nr:hypothetical protein [Solirubrobacterales bacterium]
MRQESGNLTRTGAGALVALAMLLAAFVGSASAAIQIEEFGGSVLDEAGLPEHQAAAHPYEASTHFKFPMDANGLSEEDLKTAVVHLPPGFIGNPLAVPRCEEGRSVNLIEPENLCPASSQVGIVDIGLKEGLVLENLPVYSLDPPPGVPARFGFNVIFPDVFVEARLRPDDYGIDVIARDANQALNVTGVNFTFWGVPASTAHDSERIGFGCSDIFVGTPCSAGVVPKPFVTNPSDCSAGPLTTTLEVDSWQTQGVFDSASFNHDDSFSPPEPMSVEGCEALDFQPELKLQPTSSSAGSPSGLNVDLTVPLSDDPDGLAVPPVKRVEVTLPQGTAVNPSSANGLGACASAQIGLGTDAPASCPDAAKIGTVEVASPLVDHPLLGTIYLAKQGDNPFGSLLALYLAIEDEESGVVVKLPGRVTADPVSGQLRAVFDDNPQLPFESMRIRFKGGNRAPLSTPTSCGTYATSFEISSWAGQSVSGSSSFQITSGPNGAPCPSNQFAPGFDAGTVNPVAGSYSPFVLRLTREDGTQPLGAVTATLPDGLLGRLKGIPYCSDAALAGVSGALGTGATQLAASSCPAASQVGTVSVGAGAGPNPFYVDTGKAYLAGPYKGAPLSMAFITPAIAGPFDLGSVVVRAALRVNPVTAQITAVSDPLPSILHGIPLNLRDVRVNLSKPEFTLNPTSCDPMGFTGLAYSALGASAPLAERFQVAGCGQLAFEPTLKMRFYGAPPRRGGFPKLKAVLTAPRGQANIGKAVVLMPKTELLEQGHIRTICTRDQWASDSCPKASIYGKARAWTPLLDKPLQGDVYLRANGGARELPDLVADLKGQIEIELVGYVDSVNARLRTRFVNVPDAPVSRFVLDMQGGRKGLLAHNTNVCKTTPRASVKFDGQNGKFRDLEPRVAVGGCGKGKQRGR